MQIIIAFRVLQATLVIMDFAISVIFHPVKFANKTTIVLLVFLTILYITIVVFLVILIIV